MKVKFKNKFEEYKEKKGTVQKGESMTDQSQAEDCDIYACLKKYGITTLVNQTQAKEFMYLDNTNRNMTLDEAVRVKKQMEEYFKQQPARVRKVFGDNVDMFIEKYKAGQFDDFLSTGVLNEEMVKALTPIEMTPIEGGTNVKVEENITNPTSTITDINKRGTTTVATDNGSL